VSGEIGERVRLAEVAAALSIATDLGTGQRPESGLSVCVLATRLADRLGIAAEERSRAYYLALLRDIGCTVAAHEFAAQLGDEIGFRRGAAGLDLSSRRVLLRYAVGYSLAHGRGTSGRLATYLRLAARKQLLPGSTGVGEVAQRLAARLGFGERLQRDLLLRYERHDGTGFPRGLPGTQITWPARVVQAAEAAVVHAEFGGVDAAVATLRARRRRAYHPDVVDAFCADPVELLDGLRGDGVWRLALGTEPGEAQLLSSDAFDEALRVMGDFADLKSPYTMGHSGAVADLAAEAARRSSLPAAEVMLVRRAGWVHDLGRVGVGASVWGSPAPLTGDQWAQVRLRPHYTERILDQSAALLPLAAIAGAHHERPDSVGHHRDTGAAEPAPSARLLAAADVYQALTEERPYRAAFSAEVAAKELQAQAGTGQLDGDAVSAVLKAAAQRVPRRRTGFAGLTSREIDILRLLARGGSTAEISGQLGLSHRTVEEHIERIYAKAGVRTRAAAAAFALQYRLIEPAG